MRNALKFYFDVCGHAPFPMDMLTMDECFPTTVVDGLAIVNSMTPLSGFPPPEKTASELPKRKINLTVITTDRYWQPKIAHWNKRGWTVGVIREELNERVI